MSNRYLEGRAAWVTGAASGMARGIALALARAGADVAVGSLLDEHRRTLVSGETADLLTAAELIKLGNEISAEGVRVHCGALDIRSEQSIRGFFEATIGAFGKVDILVNAAYAGAKHAVIDHPDPLWHALMDTNLTGAFRTIRLCLPGMIERRWGRIVNIASTAASVGFSGSAAYCASKAGLLGLTRCAALEGAQYGVSCNAISPGWVDSRQSRDAYRHQLALDRSELTVEQFLEKAKQSIPQKRLLEPLEIGAFVAFLCREEALGITGEDLRISAGSVW